MKKLICIAVIIATLFTFVACGRMEGISDDAYEYGLAALETADEFIDGKIDAKTAKQRLDHASDLVDNCEGENDFLVAGAIFRTSLSIWLKDSGSGTMATVKENRNDLADLLGK